MTKSFRKILAYVAILVVASLSAACGGGGGVTNPGGTPTPIDVQFWGEVWDGDPTVQGDVTVPKKLDPPYKWSDQNRNPVVVFLYRGAPKNECNLTGSSLSKEPTNATTNPPNPGMAAGVAYGLYSAWPDAGLATRFALWNIAPGQSYVFTARLKVSCNGQLVEKVAVVDIAIQ